MSLDVESREHAGRWQAEFGPLWESGPHQAMAMVVLVPRNLPVASGSQPSAEDLCSLFLCVAAATQRLSGPNFVWLRLRFRPCIDIDPFYQPLGSGSTYFCLTCPAPLKYFGDNVGMMGTRATKEFVPQARAISGIAASAMLFWTRFHLSSTREFTLNLLQQQQYMYQPRRQVTAANSILILRCLNSLCFLAAIWLDATFAMYHQQLLFMAWQNCIG